MLRLLTLDERVEKFRGWSSYEIMVKVFDIDIYVFVYFKKIVKPRKPRTVTIVNINFDNITLVALFNK